MGNSQKRKQEGMDAEGSPPESRCVQRRTRRLRSQDRVDQIRCAPCLCKSGFLGAQPRTLIVCGCVCLCRAELNGSSGDHVVHRACGLPRLALSPGAIWQRLETLLSSQLRQWWGAPGIQWVEVGVLLGCTWMGPMMKNDPTPNVGRTKVEKHCHPEEHFCFNSRTDRLGEMGGALC